MRRDRTGTLSRSRFVLASVDSSGLYFEHQSNTPFGQVLDSSNTSSGQSNSHPYPGNPVLTLEITPWTARVERALAPYTAYRIPDSRILDFEN